MNGNIITFYSYKGGTGRSMAVANVACLLAQSGKRVLAIDWDFEAPGLHQYFYDNYLDDPELEDSHGLIDLFWKYSLVVLTQEKERSLELKDPKVMSNALRYVQQVKLSIESPDGCLHFMGAGRQKRSYAQRVRGFDWFSFYERMGGKDFIDAFRDWLKSQYDYVLIDSRTGIADTSGICTIQMPDMVVLCFTLNRQSIWGIKAVAQSIKSQGKNREIQLFPVPMRVQSGAEGAKEAWAFAKEQLNFLVKDTYFLGIENYWEEVEVAYRAEYSFLEKLAVIHDGKNKRDSMKGDMIWIAKTIANNMPLNGTQKTDQISEHEPAPKEFQEELGQYSQWAQNRYNSIDLNGVGAGDLQIALNNIYIPLQVIKYERYQQEEGIKELARGELFDITQRASVVLFGDPGSGKSTTLRKLLLHYLEEKTTDPEIWQATPIFIRLRKFTENHLKTDLKQFIFQELDEVCSRRFSQVFKEQLWKRGNLLLLMDGLDEIDDPGLRAKVADKISNSLLSLREQRIRGVVTCRHSGCGGKVKLGEPFVLVTLSPLDHTQVEQFVYLWLVEVHKKRGISDGTERARREVGNFIKAMGAEKASVKVKALLTNPLLLTSLCLILLREGQIPRGRAEIYRHALELLLHRWVVVNRKRAFQSNAHHALSLLESLAWTLHSENNKTYLSRSELALFIEKFQQKKLDGALSAFNLLRWLYADAGILGEFGTNSYGFAPPGFQEYLAARHVANRFDEYLELSGSCGCTRSVPQHLANRFDECLELSGSCGCTRSVPQHLANRSDECLERLVGRTGDPWWHEVILMLAGMANLKLFSRLMDQLLVGIEKPEREKLVRQCLLEAQDVDLDPFLAWLEPGKLPEAQAAVLRLMVGRDGPTLLQAVAKLQKSSDPTVKKLADQFFNPNPALVNSENPPKYQLFLAYLRHDRQLAETLSERLYPPVQNPPVQNPPVQIWPIKQRISPESFWLDHLEEILDETATVFILAGEDNSDWATSEMRSALALFNHYKRRLIPVQMAESGEVPPLPEFMRKIKWIQGYGPVALDRLRRGAQWWDELMIPAALPSRHRSNLALREPHTGIRLLPVSGGNFLVGRGAGDPGKTAVHKVSVSLSPYWLGETPVTNKQYALYLSERRGAKKPPKWQEPRFSDPEQPVVGVSWHEALSFCQWLSEFTGFLFTLPSEVQWEFAARGEKERPFPWGNEPPTPERACFQQDESTGKLALAGSYLAGSGPFGHLDLAGTVWEWCRDDWQNDLFRYNSRPASERILRGGSWVSGPDSLRATSRFARPGDYCQPNVGFRVAFTPPSSASS